MSILHFLAQVNPPRFEINGVGPELFADRAKAWVEALAVVLDILIAKIGVLGLAIIAVWQNLRKSAIPQEVKERLDRQADRIDKVALSVPTIPLVAPISTVDNNIKEDILATPVRVVNPISDPVKTSDVENS